MISRGLAKRERWGYDTFMSDSHLAYLIDFLEDEFRNDSGVTLKPHRRLPWGIYVKTKSREYFFDLEWAVQHRFERIREEVERVRSGLAMLGYSNQGIRDDGRPDPYKDY